jgi:hypothetical protein
MASKIYELTETETKAVIGGARMPVSPYQSRPPVSRRPTAPAAS